MKKLSFGIVAFIAWYLLQSKPVNIVTTYFVEVKCSFTAFLPRLRKAVANVQGRQDTVNEYSDSRKTLIV